MTTSIDLHISQRPSITATAFLALLGRSSKFDPEKPFPKITAQQNSVKIDRNQLSEFNSLCGIKNGDKLPAIYPFALIYPVLQRILARKEAPLSLFVVLNSRMQVRQKRAIRSDEQLDIYCSIAGHRLREKGLEMDIASAIKSAGVTVWENTQTFYYRGHFGKPDENYQPPRWEEIPDAGETARWFLPEGVGKRFSKVSGDGNPIHFWPTYARLLGFKRDFAQPLLVLGTSLTHLLKPHDDMVALDVTLKAPVYYGNMVALKSAAINDSIRFDVLCGDNPLPCICGKLKSLPKLKSHR